MWQKLYRWLPLFAFFAFLVFRLLVRYHQAYPPIGSYIAILAFVGAFVTVWLPDNNWSKGGWIVVFLLLVVFEIHNLYRDRDEHDRAERRVRKEEADRFKSVADGLESVISNSNQQFSITMRRTDSVLTSITGGDSYCAILPMLNPWQSKQDAIPLAIENHGSSILTGVSVTVYASGVWMKFTENSILNSVANRITVGTLHPKERLILNAQIKPEQFMDFGENGRHLYRVFVYVAAQNFTIVEYLDFKKVEGDKWNFEYLIYKQPPPKNAVALEKID